MIWIVIAALIEVANAVFYGMASDKLLWIANQATIASLAIGIYCLVPIRRLLFKWIAACLAVHSVWILGTDWAIEYLDWWAYVTETTIFVLIGIAHIRQAKIIQDIESS